MSENKLYRPSDDMMLAGVCSGLARHFGLSVSTVRLITFLLIFFGGVSLLAYIILWIIMPRR